MLKNKCFSHSTEDYSTSQTKGADAFKFNLNKLYSTICKIPNTDEVTLLLYMLLHRNSSVKQDIMRRSDIQLLASSPPGAPPPPSNHYKCFGISRVETFVHTGDTDIANPVSRAKQHIASYLHVSHHPPNFKRRWNVQQTDTWNRKCCNWRVFQ